MGRWEQWDLSGRLGLILRRPVRTCDEEKKGGLKTGGSITGARGAGGDGISEV